MLIFIYANRTRLYNREIFSYYGGLYEIYTYGYSFWEGVSVTHWHPLTHSLTHLDLRESVCVCERVRETLLLTQPH